MRGCLHLRVPGVLGLTLVIAACASMLPAQHPVAAEAPPAREIQTETDPFAESTKLLTEASTKEARADAFKAVLRRARELKQDPRPLVDVLKNKQPQATFVELLQYLKDNADERHKAFLPTLVMLAHDTGDPAAVSRELVLAYKPDDALDTVAALLRGSDARGAVAAAAICREHIGGLAGMARVVGPLVDALDSQDTELRAAAHRSLRNITRLKHDADPKPWREWLKGKDHDALVREIGNRWIEAKKERDKEFDALQQELLKVLIDRMRKDDRKDAARLIEHLAKSPYMPVREEAATLLGELLKDAEVEAAKVLIAALGDQLLQPDNPEPLRIACIRALAVKSAASFEVISRCLDQNGNSPAVKLELVRALRSPVATARLALLLKEEIDRVEKSSSRILLDLLTQSRSIVAKTSDETARKAVLAEFSRLLEIIEARLALELPAPELARFDNLAREACSALSHFARFQLVDISSCVPALMGIAAARIGAASSAVSALREALEVSRAVVTELLTAEPLTVRLRALYDRLSGERNEPLLVGVIGLYEALGIAPRDMLDDLRKRLLDFARTSADSLADPTRQTLRGAVRSLLARLVKGDDKHKTLITELLETPFGDNDVIAYIRLMQPPRVATAAAALSPHVSTASERVAAILKELSKDQKAPNLTTEELADTAYTGLWAAVEQEVRSIYERRIKRGLEGGEIETAEKLKTDLIALADAQPRLFIEAAHRQLSVLSEPGANRDVVAQLLMERLKASHAGRYDQDQLAGDAAAFKAALQAMAARLKQDGYRI